MSLINDLINDLVESKVSLTSALLKTKVIAHKLDNKQLLDWVNAELNGYINDDVPEYRVVKCQVVGSIVNGFYRLTNTLIPIGHLPKEAQDQLTTSIIKNSVSNLENVISKSAINKLGMRISPEICSYLSRGLEEGWIDSASKEIDKTQIIQILTNIRSKLLDFVIELRKQVGDIETTDSDKLDKNKVNQILNTTIIGHGNVILSGDYNYLVMENNIYKGDLGYLKKTLLKLGLTEDDVTDLEFAVNNDQPDAENKTYGRRVKDWIAKMFQKSLDGTWEISIGAAGNLLAEALKKYYGF